MNRSKAAFGFPFRKHRTIADIDREADDEFERLDALSRIRALTDQESHRMYLLIKKSGK